MRVDGRRLCCLDHGIIEQRHQSALPKSSLCVALLPTSVEDGTLDGIVSDPSIEHVADLRRAAASHVGNALLTDVHLRHTALAGSGFGVTTTTMMIPAFLSSASALAPCHSVGCRHFTGPCASVALDN